MVFFEPKRRYWVKGEVDETIDDALPLDQARVVVEGTDVTLVAYGPLVVTARDAALAAAGRRGVDRGDRPALVVAAGPRHGRDVGPQDRPARRDARGPALRSGSVPRSPRASPSAASTCCGRPPSASPGSTRPYPAAKLEEHFLPDLDRLLDAVDRVMGRQNSLTGWRRMMTHAADDHVARSRRGPHRVRPGGVDRRGRRHRRAEPGGRGGRDREGARPAAVALRRRGRRAARRAGHDRPGRRAAAHDRGRGGERRRRDGHRCAVGFELRDRPPRRRLHPTPPQPARLRRSGRPSSSATDPWSSRATGRSVGPGRPAGSRPTSPTTRTHVERPRRRPARRRRGRPPARGSPTAEPAGPQARERPRRRPRLGGRFGPDGAITREDVLRIVSGTAPALRATRPESRAAARPRGAHPAPSTVANAAGRHARSARRSRASASRLPRRWWRARSRHRTRRRP